jgi:serine/threonine-protein kinase
MNELKQLGRYQLLRVLGRGAMGLVYEGVDPKLNRRVAIKVIQMSRIDDPALRAEYAARFIIEAQAVARLNHPNIVTVYDFGEESGVAYLVMELIAGEELGSYFDDSQVFSLDFTLEDSVRMTCELLDALDYAHQQGIIHRDIKPANVMLTGQLRVKLTDFGVARMQDVEANHTQAGTMVGTPSYMSPEQIMGQPVGPRADIFAAGIILYQFLTGERPFKGQGLFALQQQIVYGQVPPPSTLSPLISPAFDRVVLRALAKRPDDRYPSARAFRDDLQRALAADGANPAETLPPPVRGQQPGMAHASSPGMPAWQPAPAGQPQATHSGAHWPAAPQAHQPQHQHQQPHQLQHPTQPQPQPQNPAPGQPYGVPPAGANRPAPQPYTAPHQAAAPVQPSGAGWPAQPPAGYAPPPRHPGWPAPADMPSGLVMPSHPRPGLAPLPDDADPDATHVSGTSLAIPPLQPLPLIQPGQAMPPAPAAQPQQPLQPAHPARPAAGGDADSTVVGATTPPGGARR